MRKVFDVYGVSSETFNDPDNKTMSNKREAIRSMYTDRVIPDVESFVDELQRWVSDWYEEDLVLTLDLSGVEALNEEREKKAKWLSQLPELPPNIVLQEMGYEPMDNPIYDEPWMPSNRMPAGTLTDTLNLEAELTYTDKIFENGH
jgi:phage portal protein BeeE